MAYDFIDVEENPRGINSYLTGGSNILGKKSRLVNTIGATFLTLLFFTIFIETVITTIREKRRIHA